MGVHIHIQDVAGKDHPEWDSVRCAGDRDFAATWHDLPAENGGYDNECVRPTDFPAWRERCRAIDAESGNPGRLEKLVDILEKEPGYWLYFSY